MANTQLGRRKAGTSLMTLPGGGKYLRRNPFALRHFYLSCHCGDCPPQTKLRGSLLRIPAIILLSLCRPRPLFERAIRLKPRFGAYPKKCLSARHGQTAESAFVLLLQEAGTGGPARRKLPHANCKYRSHVRRPPQGVERANCGGAS